MKVKELIEKLMQLDQEAMVIFERSGEGGLDEVDYVAYKDIVLNKHDDSWYGKHDDWHRWNDGEEKVIAVEIGKE